MRAFGGALLLAAIATPVCLSLFTVDWFESHETATYLARVVEVSRCWEDGMPSARWFPDLGAGGGLPYLSFYAPLTFWTAAALHAAGASVPSALKIVVVLATMLGVAGAYRLGREGAGRAAAFAGAAVYAYAPYQLRNLWVRGDLAEYVALAFLPWAVWGTLRTGRFPTAGIVVLTSAAGAAAILSHNIAGMLTGLAMATTGLIVVLASPPERRARATVALLVGGAGALSLSAFFWVPSLVEKKWTHLGSLQEEFFAADRNFLRPRDLLGFAAPARAAVPGQPEVMTHELRLLIAVGVAAPLSLLCPDRHTRVAAIVGAVLGAAGLAMSLSIGGPVYDALPPLRWVQFPWRFLSLTSVGAAILTTTALAGVARVSRAPVVGALALACAAAAVLGTRDIQRPLGAIDVEEWMLDPAVYRDGGLTMGAVEFTPIWVRHAETIPFQRGVALTRGGRALAIEQGVARWRLTVEAEQAQAVVLRTFYFPDWVATLDGDPVAVRPREGSGYVEFDCPAGRHLFEGRLGPTRLRRVMGGISSLMAAVAAVAAIVALARRRSRPDLRPAP